MILVHNPSVNVLKKRSVLPPSATPLFALHHGISFSTEEPGPGLRKCLPAAETFTFAEIVPTIREYSEMIQLDANADMWHSDAKLGERFLT